jgi:hypothetical protein
VRRRSTDALIGCCLVKRLCSTTVVLVSASPRRAPPPGLFSRRAHRTAALHGSRCRPSLHRTGACVQATERLTASPSVAIDAVPTRRVTDRHEASLSVPPRDGLFRERSCRAPAEAGALRRTVASRSARMPLVCGRRTCLSRRRPGAHRFRCPEESSGRARAALMQPRDSVASRRDESNAYSSYCYEHNFQTTTDHTLASTTCLPEQGHCLGVEHGQQHFSRTQRFNHTLFRRCVTGVKILILAYHISTQACWLRFVTQ